MGEAVAVATPANMQTDADEVTVSSWDEFTQLREVIVGVAAGARLPSARTDISAWLNLFPDLTAEALNGAPDGAFAPRIIEEADEDMAALAETLAGLGVMVHRARELDQLAQFGTPDWQSTGMYSYCPRDLTLVLGETVIDCPSPTRARYYETRSLSHLSDRFSTSALRIAAPRPALLDALYSVGADGRPRLGETEPAFEAANVLRCGRDIFYQVSSSGNEAGLGWLKGVAATVAGIRVHPLRNVYPYTHIDSTIAILRPGLVLLNPERIHPDTIPAPFRSWDVIWCPEPEPTAHARFDLSSKWIGMNLLSVSPSTVVVDSEQSELIRELERRDFTVIAQQMRHQRALGGGIHCVTLDLRRDGGPENYFE